MQNGSLQTRVTFMSENIRLTPEQEARRIAIRVEIEVGMWVSFRRGSGRRRAACGDFFPFSLACPKFPAEQISPIFLEIEGGDGSVAGRARRPPGRVCTECQKAPDESRRGPALQRTGADVSTDSVEYSGQIGLRQAPERARTRRLAIIVLDFGRFIRNALHLCLSDVSSKFQMCTCRESWAIGHKIRRGRRCRRHRIFRTGSLLEHNPARVS